MITLNTLTGPAIGPLIKTLARLRMEVFRDWPYLYDGDMASEAEHLAEFARSPTSALIVAQMGADAVGCSTCMALAQEAAHIRAPFEAAGWDVEKVCYFGESVLLPAYRGQGVGVGFFAAREAHARTLPGCTMSAFCAVRRHPADPRRPAGAEPLDGFWRKRGYQRLEGLACTMQWREVGATEETAHLLDFWGKHFGGAAP